MTRVARKESGSSLAANYVVNFVSGCALVLVALSMPLAACAADKINISHSAISGSQAILFVTRDAGFFKKYDLEPQILFVSGAPPNIAALVSGEIDFTIFAGPAAIASNLEGADTVVLMTYINTMEHTFITRPDVRKPADLKGKKFGVARPGAAHDGTQGPAHLVSAHRHLSLEDAILPLEPELVAGHGALDRSRQVSRLQYGSRNLLALLLQRHLDEDGIGRLPRSRQVLGDQRLLYPVGTRASGCKGQRGGDEHPRHGFHLNGSFRHSRVRR